jgi:hypothetical protein
LLFDVTFLEPEDEQESLADFPAPAFGFVADAVEYPAE